MRTSECHEHMVIQDGYLPYDPGVLELKCCLLFDTKYNDVFALQPNLSIDDCNAMPLGAKEQHSRSSSLCIQPPLHIRPAIVHFISSVDMTNMRIRYLEQMSIGREDREGFQTKIFSISVSKRQTLIPHRDRRTST